MEILNHTAIVTGAGSGLGEATARMLATLGAKVALVDWQADKVAAVAESINKDEGKKVAAAYACDITQSVALQAAIDQINKAQGAPRILMNVAGIGTAKRIIAKDGSPASLEDFAKVVNINLLGTYNVSRLFAASCAKLAPLQDGERGVIVNTASVAAFDGQVGQEAYSASKAGVVGMTLPMARDLAQFGIRVCAIAPGLFNTPLMQTLPPEVQESLATSIPFPKRLGKPSEFAELACHIVQNAHLNGEVIRLDGALRLAPR